MFNKLKKLSKSIFMKILLSILCLGTLTGCGSKKEISIKDLGNKISQSISMSDMKASDLKKAHKLYKINTEDVDDICFFEPKSNLKASQILILKLKDTDKVGSVKESIKKYVDLQGVSFKDYLPEEFNLIEKNVLKSNGKYILLAISKDADKVEELFDKSFK